MRSFETAFPRPLLDTYQAGVMSYKYKGISCLKSPIDIAIYMQLIWQMKPNSLFEIGSNSGGSALLFSDILNNMGCTHTPLISIDINVPQIIHDPRIRFIKGNILELEHLFTAEDLHQLPHPWLVIEDSAHSHAACTAALSFFSKAMKPNDVLVIEDGVLDDLGWSDLYNGGPNKAIADFFTENPNSFECLSNLCDLFGTNATYNPNGYLRKL
ncbi:CmcI family methyltransferase [Affinirhizobium pseudoryzae]|uniref:CmcI family methyltransferase n=1 Tax=Allorhizobium pseudoryzae TaxID=379684 RepID=UPI0013EDCCD5|nr:CmcI family methyltransferase [Allorhizobium pseudoryzae]